MRKRLKHRAAGRSTVNPTARSRHEQAARSIPLQIDLTPALFAYGTLTMPEVMRAVTGRQQIGQPARLEGYACYLLRGLPYPGIRLLAGAFTEGLLYSGLDGDAWRLLDEFEDDDCYGRAILAVQDADGRRHDAAAYVVKVDYYQALSTRPWSAERFRRQRLHAFLAGLGRCRLDLR